MQLNNSKTTWGRVGPSGAEWGRVGPSGAGWGWGGVGHALGCNQTTPRRRGGQGRGAAGARGGATRMGRVGPVRAEWGRLGLSGVGEGLGMHWDSIQVL